MENLEKMEAFLKGDLQYKSELFQEILQKEISSEETLIIAEAVLYFAKQGLHHNKDGERIKQNGGSEKHLYRIYKKMTYCSLAAAALGNNFYKMLGISLEDETDSSESAGIVGLTVGEARRFAE